MGDAEEYNKDLAKRQTQINEWSYNNKMDTLFVFQLMFISLLFVGILLSLKGQGIVSGPFVWYSMGIVLILNILIIVNRSMYTNTKRDSKYWNRRHFNGDNNLSTPLSLGDPSRQSYIDSVKNAYSPSKSTTCCSC